MRVVGTRLKLTVGRWEGCSAAKSIVSLLRILMWLGIQMNTINWEDDRIVNRRTQMRWTS